MDDSLALFCLIEWYDNSPVTLGRNSYASAEEVQVEHNVGWSGSVEHNVFSQSR